MTTDRTRRLSPSELALKLACRDAVRAAGGQVFVAEQTGRCQSRISDWCSPNTSEFMPLDVIAKVEALSAGAPGHPHVTRTLARASEGSFVPCPAAVALDLPNLGRMLAEVAGESSDVIGLLAAGQLGAAIEALAMPDRIAIADECEDLVEKVAAVERRLRGCDTS
jgi:hypothetical protein